jgi:hypothetical protein
VTPQAPPAGSSYPIEVRVAHLESLFQTLDPSPFREKALDPDFESYLLDCAGEDGDARPLTLVLHAPPEMRERAADLGDAIHSHFDWLLQQHARRQRLVARRHRAIVLAGFGVLAIALLLRRVLQDWGGGGSEIVSEGLLVLGWVALWRPLEALLFDRQAARERRGLLQRLSVAQVAWREAPGPAPR